MPWDKKKCRSMLESILGPKRVVDRHGWVWLTFEEGPSREITLDENAGERIVLYLYPGANVEQARLLHDKLDQSACLGLNQRDRQWLIERDFHLANAYRIRFSSKLKDQVPGYLDYWGAHKQDICEVKVSTKTTLTGVLSILVTGGVLTPSDEGEAKKELANCKILRICPGLAVTYRWPVAEAERLAAEGVFVSLVRAKVEEAFATWCQAFR